MSRKKLRFVAWINNSRYQHKATTRCDFSESAASCVLIAVSVDDVHHLSLPLVWRAARLLNERDIADICVSIARSCGLTLSGGPPSDMDWAMSYWLESWRIDATHLVDLIWQMDPETARLEESQPPPAVDPSAAVSGTIFADDIEGT